MLRRLSQYWRSLSNAASAFAGLRYFPMVAVADFLLMVCEFGGSNFWSFGFSWYPRMKTICCDSPGSRFSFTCREAIGAQLCAIELGDSPAAITAGLSQPR